MQHYKETKILTNENIALFVKEIVETYETLAKKRAVNSVKLALTVEEILLQFKDNYGDKTPCTVNVGKSSSKITIEVRQKGPQINPLEYDSDDDIGFDILSRMGVVPRYYYKSRSGANIVKINADMKPRKNQMVINILIAVALAFLCSFAISGLSADTQGLINDALITPVFNKLMAVITTVATPLVFLAILGGISDIGDVNSLGKIGSGYLKEMFGTYFVAGLAFTIPSVLVYHVSLSGAGGDEGGIKDIIQLVLDIIPNNLLQPFTVDNDLQVVVVAIFIGIAILKLQEKSDRVRETINLISEIVNIMMSMVIKILPLIVFVGILKMLNSDMHNIGKVYIAVILFILSSVIVILYLIIRVKSLYKGLSIREMLKKQWPTAMINLATSSQVSALPENVICCKKKFGIDDKLVDFGLPLGVVVYMPNGACFMGLTVWCLANLAGVETGIFQMIIIMIMAVIVAIAAPPIPGSALVVLPMMMSISNVPNDYFPIAVILATVLGYFLPLLNGYCLQLHLAILAKKLNMVDEEVMYRPYVDEE